MLQIKEPELSFNEIENSNDSNELTDFNALELLQQLNEDAQLKYDEQIQLDSLNSPFDQLAQFFVYADTGEKIAQELRGEALLSEILANNVTLETLFHVLPDQLASKIKSDLKKEESIEILPVLEHIAKFLVYKENGEKISTELSKNSSELIEAIKKNKVITNTQWNTMLK